MFYVVSEKQIMIGQVNKHYDTGLYNSDDFKDALLSVIQRVMSTAVDSGKIRLLNVLYVQ